MKRVNNSSTWSLSRMSLYRFCRRGFFFRYCAEPTQELSHLKKLLGLPLWKNILLRDAIIENIRFSKSRKPGDRISEIGCEVIKKIRTGWNNFLAGKRHGEDGRNLAEIFYNDDNVSLGTIFNDAENSLKNIVSKLNDSELIINLLESRYLNLKDLKSPDSFLIGGITVWVSPDLVWQDKDGNLNLLKFHFGTPEKNPRWDIQNGVYALYGSEQFKVALGRLAAVSVFFPEDDSPPLTVHAYRNIREIREIIASESAELDKFQENPVLDDEIFSSESPKCRSCEFRSLCEKDFCPVECFARQNR